MKMKSLIIIVSAFLSAAALLFAFSSNIKLALVKYYASSFIEGGISYERAFLDEKGTVLIEGLQMLAHSIEKDRNIRFQAMRVELDVCLSLWPPKACLDIRLFNPNLSLHGIKPLEKVIIGFQGGFPFLELQTLLTVSQGKLSLEGDAFALLVDGTIDIAKLQKSSISIKDAAGAFSLAYDGNQQEAFHLECKNARLAPLFNILSPSFPALSSFLMQKGTLDGALSFVKGKDGFQSVQGSLDLKNLVIQSTSGMFLANVPIFHIEADFQKKVPRLVIGKGSLGNEAELTFQLFEGEPYRFVLNEAMLSIETVKAINYQLAGKSLHNGEVLPIVALGSIDLFHPGKEAFSLNFGFANHQKGQAKAEISVRELGHGWRGVSLSVGNITKREFQFFKDLAVYFPAPLPQVDFKEGTIDGVIKGHIYKDTIKEVSIDGVCFNDSSLDLKDLNLFLTAKNIFVKGILNLTAKESADCMTIQADIHDARVIGRDPFTYVADQCNAVAALENGVLKKISAEGYFQGMKSGIEYDASNNFGVLIKLSCPSRAIENFISPKLKRAVQQSFSEDLAIIEAVLKESGCGYDIRGKLDLFSLKEKTLGGKFGFKTSKGIHEKMPLEEGWLFFENVNLTRIVAPLLLLDENGYAMPIDLRGTATVQGKFDSKGLLLSYDAKDVVLESEDFEIAVDRIYQNDHFGEKLTPASHYFSFLEDTHFGEIPIRKGTYKDKSSLLEFQNIACNVAFENKKIHVGGIDTLSSGIHFLGNIDIDYSIPGIGSADIIVETDEISGKAADLKDFISHLKSDSYISYIPLNGEVSSGLKDSRFVFKVRNEGTEVFSKVKGSLFEGTMNLAEKNASLQELGFNLFYESKGKLEISDIQGTLIVGDLKKPREYLLNSEGIVFDTISSDGKFNLWVEGSDHEILRLEGVSKGRVEGNDFYIDILPSLSKSHCLGIHPKEFRLVINAWEKIKLFSLGMDIDISSASKEFKEGVAKFSTLFAFEEGEKNDPLSGHLRLQLNYGEELESLTFHTLFENLKIGTRAFKEAEIQGSYRNKTLFIDNFLFDDLSFAAEIAKEDRLYLIRFLGGSIKGKMAFGIEGKLQEDNMSFFGKIRHFEAKPEFLELFQVCESDALKRFQGGVKGNGTFTVCKGESSAFDFGVEMLLNGDLSIDSCCSFKLKPFTFSYSKARGITLKNCEASFCTHSDEVLGTVNFGKEASFSEGKSLTLSNVTFTLKPKGVKPLFDLLSPCSPFLGNGALQRMFTECEDDFSGILSLVGKEDSHTFFLSLREGKLALDGTARLFQNFSLEATGEQFRLLADFSCGSRWIRARLLSKDPAKNQGTIEFSDPLCDNSSDNHLSVSWKKNDDFSIIVQNAKGSCAGMHLDMYKASEDQDSYVLQGTVKVDTEKIAPYNGDGIFIDSGLTQFLGKTFNLTGSFKLIKNAISKLTFDGRLDISSVFIRDFLVNHIEAEFTASKEEAFLKNIEIHDTAGMAKIPKMHVAFQGSKVVDIPLLQAYSIRPANLATMDGLAPIKNKALKINELKLTNFSFSLKDPANCKAEGWLKFSNTSKTLLQNALFQIPKEIITRLGLNPSVLTPVKGEIFFELGHEKIFIKRLKDVFSEGRVSKFYLASKGSPSFIDFDGNLMVKIRMKHDNLLFKLAELFTVTVKGTYKKPQYFLQKQE